MVFEPSTPPLPGDTVGAYVLEEVVGVGGMATVYRAASAEHGAVAVKILHPGKSQTEEARRFRREFLTLRELRHPGVVRVYEAGLIGEYPWIAMEFVDGIDLATLSSQWKERPPADRFQQAERIVRGLAEALAYVHERGLIHRDLKPSNVLMTRDGVPKLTDFGVVKATSGVFTTQLTVAGKLIGTVAFMAPEQITGDAVDARVDLYSLGALFYELLTGQRPIVADSIAGYLARHLTENPRPPSEIDPGLPPRLERVCLRLLRKDPDQRYASAKHLLAALDSEEAPRRPPLHGRHTELARLMARLGALRDGAGGVMVVEGALGAGKTALMTELSEQARASGYSVASCVGAGVDPLERLSGQLPASSPDDGDLPVGPRIAARTSGQPWVLVIDDVDRLSRSDLDALTSLVRDQVAIEGEPLLVICTTTRRDGVAAAFLSGAATGLTPDWLRISGLDRRATIAMVRDLGVSGAAGAALGSRLFEELSGRPGAVDEQIDTLLRAGWLTVDPSGEGLRATRSVDDLREAVLPVPERIRSREQRRLARLEPDARAVFDALAVVGMDTTRELLAQLTGLTASAIGRAVRELVADGLVHQRVEGVHEIVQMGPSRQRDLAYSLIDPAARAELHRRVARSLSGQTRRRAGPMAEVVARHLLHGGQLAQAYPMLLDAARRQVRAGHIDEAHKLLRQALDARPAAEALIEGDRVQQLRRSLYTLEGEVLEQSGDLSGATSAWERAVTAAEFEGDERALLRARSGLGLVQAARGQGIMAADGLEQALQALPQGDPMWPRVAQALATARLTRGDTQGAEDLWRRLGTLGREGGGSQAQVQAEAGLAVVDMVRGQLVQGRRRLDQAEQGLRRAGSTVVRLDAVLRLAWIALADGRLIEAGERAAEAERIAWDVSRIIGCVTAMGVSALARHARGDDEDARRLAQEATELHRSRSDGGTSLEIIATIPVARAWCDLGEDAEAVALLPDAPLPDAAGLDDPNGLLQATAARAWARRDPGRAVALAQRALLRPPAYLPWAAARVALDAGLALEIVGDPLVSQATTQALQATALPGLRLQRLEALLLSERVGIHHSTATERDHLRDELQAELGRPSLLRAWWL